MKKFGPYLIFLAAMLWATDAPFRVHLTQDLPSNFIVLVEHMFDVLVVLPILFWNLGALKALKSKDWAAVLIIAVGGSALASVAFTQAFHYVNPSVAILLQKLQPLMAIGLAGSLLGERLTKNFWLWAGLALLGAYFISFSGFRPRLFPGEAFNPNLIGVLLALLAAAFWGASTVLGRYVLKTVNFKAMTALRFVIALVFLFVLNASQGTLAFGSVTPKDWLYLLIIAIASGVVSLFVYYRGLAETKASVATLAELGFPMAAVLVNWYFLHQGLSWPQIGGMAVLLGAIFMLARQNQLAAAEVRPIPAELATEASGK